MKNLFLVAVAICAVMFFTASCGKYEFEDENLVTETNTNTHTVDTVYIDRYTEVPVYIEVPGEDKIIEIPIEVPVYVYVDKDIVHEKIPAGKPTLTSSVDCKTNTVRFKIHTVFTDPYFAPETKEFSYRLRNSAWGEEVKNVGVSKLEIKVQGDPTMTTTASYPETVEENILSVMVNKMFTQKFTEGVTSSAFVEEEHIWVTAYGHIFGPFKIEHKISFVNSEVSSTPSGEKDGKDIYPAAFNFMVEMEGGCSTGITNDINLLMKKKPVTVIRKENRNYGFCLEKKKANRCGTFFPSYYDSYYEVWAIYSDGKEEFIRKESDRGSIKWSLAQSTCKEVGESVFNGIRTVSAAFPANGISVGTNVQGAMRTSTVVVGNVSAEFKARPSFTWSEVKNSVEKRDNRTKVNKTEVKSTCSNGEAFGPHPANVTFCKKSNGGC